MRKSQVRLVHENRQAAKSEMKAYRKRKVQDMEARLGVKEYLRANLPSWYTDTATIKLQAEIAADYAEELFEIANSSAEADLKALRKRRAARRFNDRLREEIIERGREEQDD